MKRQFVWFMTDTTRYDMIGCYRHPEMNTPNIDSMAQDGMRFEYAYSCQPVCGPARSALFTGVYPHANGSWGNSMPLNNNIKNVGEILSENGVLCGYIGKWHLDTGDYFGRGVADKGWDSDTWYDMRNYLSELSDSERILMRKSSSAGCIDENMTFAYRCAERAIKFIENHKDEDFLLVVSFDEPHGPSVCPEPFASMDIDYEIFRDEAYKDDLKNKPMFQQIWGGSHLPGKAEGDTLRPYALVECNSFVDNQIGKIRDTMEKYVPMAMSLFTSDHGDALKAHNLSGKGASVYDEISRIPLIFHGPIVKKGEVYKHVTSHIDLAATVTDYFIGKLDKQFQGKSLLNILKDPDDKKESPIFIEFGRFCCRSDQFGGFQPYRGIITNQYKLGIHMAGDGEMYDIVEDPANIRNLIHDSEFKIKRNQLLREVFKWMKETNDPFYGEYWEDIYSDKGVNA